MVRIERRGRTRTVGVCTLCGGELYEGEFLFRLGGRLYCADCVRAGRQRAGEEEPQRETEWRNAWI